MNSNKETVDGKSSYINSAISSIQPTARMNKNINFRNIKSFNQSTFLSSISHSQAVPQMQIVGADSMNKELGLDINTLIRYKKQEHFKNQFNNLPEEA